MSKSTHVGRMENIIDWFYEIKIPGNISSEQLYCIQYVRILNGPNYCD